jgi:uncharacterized surface protein with fasciclin (FAS1) repeats
MKPRIALSAALVGVALAASACSGGTDESSSSAPSTSSSTTSSTSSATPSTDAMAAGMVGSGCAQYASANPSGPGSVEGMSQDPVATAASNNPLLTTLTAAVSGKLNPDVDLVNTLNNGEFTVFAPVDDAFAKLPKDTVDMLAKEKGGATLTNILTYHVIAGQLSPDEVVGTHKTVNGAEVTVKGSGDDLTVGADDAHVICGGVKTANATVYLIDSVLMPPKM